MARYKIETRLQRRADGLHRFKEFRVWRKAHFWSLWQLLAVTCDIDDALTYINFDRNYD